MKKLRIRIRRAVCGIIFLCLLGAVILRLDSALKLMQEDNLCPRYYKYPDDTFDVTFLGSSFVLYGIYPMELFRDYGIASYNLSTGNQSMEASYYLAKESIEKDHPALIVLDCNMAWRDQETMKSQYIHYITDTMPYLSKNRMEMIRNLSQEDEDIYPLLFPLIAYHSRWQELTFEDALPQDKEMVYGARVQSRIEVSVPFKDPVPVEGDLIPETSRRYLEKTIDLCRESGTDLLLVSMPVLGKNKFFGQSGYNTRYSAAQQIGDIAAANNIPYINWFGDWQELGLDPDKDAADGEHLNRWGAEKLTRVLGAYMKEHYELPDHRGEGGVYAEIEKDCAAYPVSRMKDSLHHCVFLRDLAATLRSDAGHAEGEPVSDALVLIALNGTIDDDYLSSEDADLLRGFGLSQDLSRLEGHSYLAVIDGGDVIYETVPGEEDAADSFEGSAGGLQYRLTSGRIEEETGKIRSDASIRVNRLEYAAQERGLHLAVFDKTTGRLMDACRLNLYTDALDCTHDYH